VAVVAWNADASVEEEEENNPQEDGWMQAQHLVLVEAGVAMDCFGEGLKIRGCLVVGSDSLWLLLLMSWQTDCLICQSRRQLRILASRIGSGGTRQHQPRLRLILQASQMLLCFNAP
jgi:hypothetical protein